MSRVLLLATRSAGKLRELGPLLAAAGFETRTLDQAGITESPDEDALEAFDTFEANALAKARHFHRRSGLPTVADDSGLAVDAIGGRPGVHSKRWSARADLSGRALDDANNDMLRRALDGVPDRRAHYVCAAAFVDAERTVVTRGEVDGDITVAPYGASGFGYDPFFRSVELGLTFGEATREAKERVSHRGRAFRALVAQL